jgi:RNA polymerase sigma factor (sigma-70 family)
MTEDKALLREYADERSERAFSELVRRYIDLVFSAALRVVNGDTQLAKDVTQVVFIDLARKAPTLPTGVVLAGWLHRHTCFRAATAVRTEQRRRAREETAMKIRAFEGDTESSWEQIAPYLDEALNQLHSSDRDALVLRFLKRKDLRTVGAALGISEVPRKSG